MQKTLIGKKIIKEKANFGESTIGISDSIDTNVIRNAVYNRFKHWCFINNRPIREALVEAMESFVSSNPTEGVMPVESYHVTTVFDEMEIERDEELESVATPKIRLSKKLFNDTMRIIKRFNADPANLSKGKQNLSAYISEALELMKTKVPMKYSSPELYKEYQEILEQSKIVSQMEEDEYDRS